MKISECKTSTDLACMGVFYRNYSEMCSGELVDELLKRPDGLGDCADGTPLLVVMEPLLVAIAADDCSASVLRNGLFLGIGGC